MCFGESYWREATLEREGMFTLDKDFDEKMMQMLDIKQVAALGMVPQGSVDKKERLEFKDDFYEAYYQNKKEAAVRKNKKSRKKETSAVLAAETFTRCVKVFSRLVLDKLTVREAMRR